MPVIGPSGASPSPAVPGERRPGELQHWPPAVEVGFSPLERFTLLSSSSTTLPHPTNSRVCQNFYTLLLWCHPVLSPVIPGLNTAGSGGVVGISTLARISQAVG